MTDPEAIRQKRIAAQQYPLLERALAMLDELRIEIKNRDQTPKETRLYTAIKIILAHFRGPEIAEEVSQDQPSPSPLPEPQDVREALNAAIDFIADEYRDPSLEPQGEWLPPKARQVHAQLVAALAQSDTQPVGWQYRVREGKEWSRWFHCPESQRDSFSASERFEVRPLYTAPPGPDASGLIEAAEVLRIVDEALVEAKEISTRDPEAGTVAIWLQGVRKHIDQLRARAADRSAPRSDIGGAA